MELDLNIAHVNSSQKKRKAKIFGSLERGLDKVITMLTPSKKKRSTRDCPRKLKVWLLEKNLHKRKQQYNGKLTSSKLPFLFKYGDGLILEKPRGATRVPCPSEVRGLSSETRCRHSPS